MAEKGMQTVFETFAKDGKIAPEVLKNWFKEAAVIGKDTGITEADVDAAVAKTSKDKKGLEFAEIKECVNALAKEKKVEPKELMEKLAAAGSMNSVQQGAIMKIPKISLDCIKNWFKEAAVIGKDTGITKAEVDAAVAKTSKDKKGLEFAEIKECVTALAKEKKVEPKELMQNLSTTIPRKDRKRPEDPRVFIRGDSKFSAKTVIGRKKHKKKPDQTLIYDRKHQHGELAHTKMQKSQALRNHSELSNEVAPGYERFLSPFFRGRGGLVVRSQPWGRRAPGSKPDSTEDPPRMGPVAR
ncbi:hypothetical protein AVEN_108761-1 [Araneus ventricosus]|uniref:Uncharacterized protein n=1 Tax=Araneus ventricosus TaxID=182803 RepID=A0A4Y2UNN6_ARAVE|nr:hypothetical protein AVEN_108761-1 [Araneus ventricosus]